MNVDDFIASEMQQIDGQGAGESKPTMRPSAVGGTGTKSVTSKPNFGFSAGKKAGGAFAKPGFAMMGGAKKTAGGGAGAPVISKANLNPMGGQGKITLKKRAQPDDDFIENELAQIEQRGEAIDQPAAVSNNNLNGGLGMDYGGGGGNNANSNHHQAAVNIEDSEDPAQDSYASPNRQMPDSAAFGGQDIGQSQQSSTYVTPAQPNRIGQMSGGVEEMQTVTPGVVSKKPLFQPKSGMVPLKTVSASKPVMFGASGSKPGGAGSLFKKPGMMGLGKKKFQLDVAAPSESDMKVIQKVETKLLAPKITVKKMNNNLGDGMRESNQMYGAMPQKSQHMLSKASINQISGASIGEKRVADNFARPMALREKTQASLAQQKANPRPPSSIGRKPGSKNVPARGMLAQNSSGDDYSDDNYEENDFEDADDKEADAKLERLRKAMARENVNANKVVQKHNVQIRKTEEQGKPQLKMGPQIGKGKGVTMEQITREVQQMQPEQQQQQTNKLPTMKNAQQVQNMRQQPQQQQVLQTLNTANAQFSVSPQKQAAPPPQMSLEDQKNLQAFAQQANLIAGPTVDHEAAGGQETRAEELKELIGLGQEEFFDIFEMVPRTEQDVYDQKLLAGTHKLALIQTGSDNVEQETQTEDLGAQDKWNQAPDDVMVAYKQDDESVSFVTKKQKKDNDALNLEKFMGRAGPVMEQCVEENTKLRFAQFQDSASKPAAIELKQTLEFPDEILVMLGEGEQKASVLNITAVHMFETAPQSKCAIAYEVVSPRDDLGVVYLVILYSITANQVLRIMKSESEVTKMCTPADDQILIVGTDVGSLALYDLTAFESAGLKNDFFDYEALLMAENDPENDQGDTNLAKSLKKIRAKYKVLGHTFATDAMEGYKHFSPIRQLEFVSKAGSSYAQIGVMDELGVVSQWSVMEIQAHMADKIGVVDLHLNMGGRFKLLENFSESMMFMPEIFENLDGMSDIGQGMELEFDPKDSNIFYFSTSGNLFKCNRKDSMIPTKLVTEGLGAPSALSMSDEGYLLVGFSCGSIAIYHNSYTSPITVWSNACKLPIVKINWSTVYNNGSEDSKAMRGASRFMNRLCEFFVMDTAEDFYIWNINRSMDKPARVINFSTKHDSLGKTKLYTQSMTCADQTFFCGFATTDLTVKLYAMNFRKGSQINRQKVDTENKKSRKLLNTLPLTLQYMEAANDDLEYMGQ